jgi:hypothetical protein
MFTHFRDTVLTLCIDKNENEIFLTYKEIQMGIGCKVIYRKRKGFLIYKKMRNYLTIYEFEETVSHDFATDPF